MSSTADSTKHPSEGDAPTSKKVKIDDKELSSCEKSIIENNNGTTVNLDISSSKKDVSRGSNDAKTSNGDVREPDDEEDNEQDGEELTGEGLDSDLETFDPKVTKRLQSVESIQQQISRLNEQASEEILKVEQKFNKLRRPHFEQRNALLRDVPNFWVTCLANHPSVTHLIESAEDDECLRYMVDLDVEELEDIKSGYNLKFHFKENPYIRNDLIVREIRHLNSDEVESKSTPVEFKDTPQGRKLKNIVDTSIRQYTSTGNREEYSFFAWICLPCEPGPDETAEIIKDQIWPSPLEFFFQTPVDEYDGNSDDDEDEEDDESDEEEYDEEEFGQGVELQDDIPEEDIEGEELDDEDEGDEGDGEDEE